MNPDDVCQVHAYLKSCSKILDPVGALELLGSQFHDYAVRSHDYVALECSFTGLYAPPPPIFWGGGGFRPSANHLAGENGPGEGLAVD